MQGVAEFFRPRSMFPLSACVLIQEAPLTRSSRLVNSRARPQASQTVSGSPRANREFIAAPAPPGCLVSVNFMVLRSR